MQVTAAAFVSGLLELDNDIPPILASLVRNFADGQNSMSIPLNYDDDSMMMIP